MATIKVAGKALGEIVEVQVVCPACGSPAEHGVRDPNRRKRYNVAFLEIGEYGNTSQAYDMETTAALFTCKHRKCGHRFAILD